MSTPDTIKPSPWQKLNSYGFLAGVYVIVLTAATLPKYFTGPQAYNNYLIFKHSFGLLIRHQDLYIHHPEVYGDLYKYSPGFAVLMLPFYYLPDAIGLLAWNLLNGMLLFVGIKKLPLTDSQKKLVLWIILLELVTATLNSQSNALTAGLILLTFAFLKENKHMAGALSVVAAAGIKIFGAIAGIFFLFYRKKGAFLLWAIILFILWQALPLLFISPAELKAQYLSWFHMLGEDQADAIGVSVMHFLASVSLPVPFLPTQIIGLILTLLPLVFVRKYSDLRFQLLFLANILLALVLFNHKAESPTFIIAVTGCALWYCISEKRVWEKALLIFMLLFTCLSPTDVIPPFLKEEFFIRYSLKVLPCLLIWVVVQWELYGFFKTKKTIESPAA